MTEKRTLHNYQIEAVKRTVNTPNIALFLDMGLGKTLITLTAIKLLKFEYWSVRKVLVIAPKTVAECTWQMEIQKWEHLRQLRCSTILGTAKQRTAAAKADADVYIINRENVTWLVDNFCHGWDWDMVVLDESSSFKNPQAKRFKSLKAVRGKINRIVELTGTPSPKGLEDLWAQIYLLDGGQRLGKTITKYRDTFFRPGFSNGYAVYKYIPRKGSMEQVENLIRDIAVSMKSEDYLELPERIDNRISVELDARARELYDTMERDAIFQLKDDTCTAANAAAISGKLLQMCNGAVYAEDEDENQTVIHLHDCKLDALEETLEQLKAAGENAIVCYGFKHDKDRIMQMLKAKKYKAKVYTDAKDQIAWNNCEIEVLLMHPASCGYGLNLQEGGRNLIWFSLPWSLELYQQTNKRLHRQGQTKPVIIHHLIVNNSRDEDVMKALESKTATQNELIESLKIRMKEIQMA